jgi:glycosyltransferase involved in cell wall biosynthesis
MTKICVLTSVHKPFDGRIFHRQSRALAQAGHEVILVAPADFEQQEREGVRVLGVPRPASRLQRPLVWWRLGRWVLRLRPDVVHFHDPELLLLAAVLKLTFGRRIHFIYDVHEYLVDSVREKTWLPAWLRPGLAWLVEQAERLLARSLSGIVCVIQDQLPLYRQVRCSKVIVHNYPALDDFAGAALPPEYEPGQFRLVYIGGLFERRGVWTMLQAFDDVAGRIPNARLFMGGNYEDPGFEQRVQDFIAQRDLPVTLLGWVPFAQVKNYLTHADCAWMPGRMTLQFSNRALSTKIFEAMICSTAIVSADLPHRREYIEPAGAGLLVTPDDPAAHVDAILWLYQHPQERQAMAARGRAWVGEKYVWEQESKVLLRFYQQLLASEDTR